ncbi:MAG: hypothetical protein R2713_22095 [Ilumatobacteraceae bacterium]
MNNGPGAWMPELRGILTVIIGVFVLMGSVYFILLTNMGARLAFLVSFSALAGWFFLMGAIWWIYGIGLKGPEPSWDPVPGRTVIQAPEALLTAEVLDSPIEVLADPVQTAEAVQDQFVEEGWAQLPPEAAAYGRQHRPRDLPHRLGCLRRRRLPGDERVRHRWRALPTPRRRQGRLPGLLAQASAHRRRGGAGHPGARRAGARPGTGAGRREPAAPVRLHGAQQGREASAGGLHHGRLADRVPGVRVVAAPS